MSEGKKTPTRRSVGKKTKKLNEANVSAEAPEGDINEKQVIGEQAEAKNPTIINKGVKSGKKRIDANHSRLRWPQIILLVIIFLVLCAGALFAWDRWLRYNDAADIQGEWIYTSEGSTVPVHIDKKSISFSTDVAFPYTLDSGKKTIEFSFTDLIGSGVYRFSPDRKTLYIAEDSSEDIFTSIQVSLGLKPPNEGFDPEKTTVLVRQDVSSALTTPEEKGIANDVSADKDGALEENTSLDSENEEYYDEDYDDTYYYEYDDEYYDNIYYYEYDDEGYSAYDSGYVDEEQ